MGLASGKNSGCILTRFSIPELGVIKGEMRLLSSENMPLPLNTITTKTNRTLKNKGGASLGSAYFFMG